VSPWPMISIEEANRISLMHTEPLSAVAVPLAQSLVAPLPPVCEQRAVCALLACG
jgi:hypothetical protein